MPKVLIIGAGLAGAAASRELSSQGKQVLLIEETEAIGGKVRGYGCKALESCVNCGLCLTNTLWSDVENNSLIDIRLNTQITDLSGEKGNYTAALKSLGEVSYVEDISDVIVATGFDNISKANYNSFIEIESINKNTESSVITGSDIERIMKGRNKSQLFVKSPCKIAFIQCYGSRDIKENAMYCSRVCCAYSSRAAKLIKKYYPDCAITFFYMEMQQVRNGNYFDELKNLGINFIKCRPVKIKDSNPACIVFDNPETGERTEEIFDLIVLSDGIRSSHNAARIAEICGLGQTENGFLRYVKDIHYAQRSGVYVIGCAKGPAKIEETYADSIAVARLILAGER